MKRIFAAISLLTLSTGGGGALAADDNLRAALDVVPEEAFSNPSPLLANFVDMQAIAEMGDASGRPHPSRLAFAIEYKLRPLDALMSRSAEEWSGKAGVGVADLRYFAGSGSVPDELAVWGLAGDDQVENLLSALAERDFAPVDGLEGALANGEPGAVNLSARDHEDPWRGPLGRTSVVAAHGGALLQAAAPGPVRTALESERSLLDSAAFEAAAAGIEHAAQGGSVVQAGIYSPVVGMFAVDPAVAMLANPRDMDAAREALEKAIDEAVTGLPPYFGAIIADIQHGESPGLAISLAYPDCQTAEQGASLAAEIWRATIGAELEGEIVTATVSGKDGVCAAVLSVIGPTVEGGANPLVPAVLTRIARQDFTVLRIGTAP